MFPNIRRKENIGQCHKRLAVICDEVIDVDAQEGKLSNSVELVVCQKREGETQF